MKKIRWTLLGAVLLAGCLRAETPEASVEELRADEAPVRTTPRARAPVAAAPVAAAPAEADCRGGCGQEAAALDDSVPSCDHGTEIAPPAAIRDTLPLTGSARLGDEDAPVTVVVATDFQCPFCRRGHATLRQLVEMYGDRITVVLKHNPLPFHDHALGAGLAAEAAGRQGKFWEMADLLFSHQEALDRDSILELARSLRLNMHAFEYDIESTAVADRIRADQDLAQSLGARGTPTFWVNGRRIAGAQPLSVFRAVIDEELAARD